jgi:hypothetical protein
MTEPTAEKSMQRTDDTPSKRTARRRPAYLEEGAFPRLQERTQSQLGFINSLLVTLAVGLLAFAANASGNSAELDRLGWRKWLLFVGLLVLALSVLSGLRLAFNRLASHRITTRVARLRQLRDRYGSEERVYELRRLGRQAVFFESWAWGSPIKRREKQGVRTAAKALAKLIPASYKPVKHTRPPDVDDGHEPVTSDVSKITRATTDLVEALRSWYERADDWTWVWLRWQTWFFIGGAALLLVVPLSYY